MDEVSNAVKNAITATKDPITLIKSLFSGNLPIGSTAKDVVRNKHKLQTVQHFSIKKTPIPRVKNVTPTRQKFKNWISKRFFK